MKEKTPFDFERFKAEAMQGLYEGKSLSHNDGILAPLMKHLLESIMDAELENQLNEEKALSFIRVTKFCYTPIFIMTLLINITPAKKSLQKLECLLVIEF